MKDSILTSFSQDQFDRQSIAENLTNIILAKEEPLVIALDSDWGTGKTTFIHMWKDLLDTHYKENFKTIYFNAWENDYIKNPLLAIFSEFEQQIQEEDSKVIQAFKSLKEVITPYIEMGTSVGIKLLSQGILEKNDFSLGEKLEDNLVKLSKELGEVSFSEISTSKKLRKELKKEMMNYQSSTEKKIIFFIDELDRCRPTFAIELLEVIKHLFDIDNFIFIVSIDKEQLSHSVATIYGQNMDTVGYLRRFFDLDYKLPKIEFKKYIQMKNKEILSYYSNINLLSFFLEELIKLYNFSLRDIDKLYYYLDVLLPQIPVFKLNTDNYNHCYIAAISYIYANLIIIKIKEPIVFKKIMNCNYTVDEILQEINTIDIQEYDTHIGGNRKIWHTTRLQRFISPILEKYLKLNLKLNNQHLNQRYTYSEEFVIPLTDEQGNPVGGWDNKTDLINFFTDHNIMNTIEFINNFKLN